MSADFDEMTPFRVTGLSRNRGIVFPERQLSAVFAVCKAAIRERRDLSILIFGPPGSGKTSFALEIATQLASTRPSKAKPLRVITLTGHIEGELSSRKLREEVTEIDKMRPVMVIWDEMDRSLTDPLGYSALWEILKRPMLAGEGEARRGSRIVIATSSLPKLLETSHLSLFDHVVYLPISDKASISALLRSRGISNENEVAKYIVTYLGGRNPSLRSLSSACSTALFDDPSHLRVADPREVAKRIVSYVGVVPRPTEIEAFEEANSGLISSSESFLERFASSQPKRPENTLANRAAEAYKLGNLCYESAEMEKAMESYRQAAEIYGQLATGDERFLPEYGHVLIRLGIVCKAKSEFEKAISYFQKANSIFKRLSLRDEKVLRDFGNTLVLLGETYKMIKEFDKSASYLEEAVKLERKKESSLATFALVSTHATLADCYLNMGNLKRAESHILSGESILSQTENRELPFAKRMMDQFLVPKERLAEARALVRTGIADLDKLLCGGIRSRSAVVLTSPSCDERDMLIKSFLEAGAKSGEVTFYLTIDPSVAKAFAEEFQSNFYLFVCNPQADAIVRDAPNIFKLKGVEDLTDISIMLTSAIRKLDPMLKDPKRICIDLISDVLLHHHLVKTRRWLEGLIPELRSNGFTTLAVMDPGMHSSQEVRAILDLFEGEINLYEKATEKGLEKFLEIKKMVDPRYLKAAKKG